jgi:hypothetical protein
MDAVVRKDRSPSAMIATRTKLTTNRGGATTLTIGKNRRIVALRRIEDDHSELRGKRP